MEDDENNHHYDESYDSEKQPQNKNAVEMQDIHLGFDNVELQQSIELDSNQDEHDIDHRSSMANQNDQNLLLNEDAPQKQSQQSNIRPIAWPQMTDEQRKKFLPSAEHVTKLVSYADVALKIEIALYNFHSILFWTAVVELFIVFMCVGFFMRMPGQMVYMFLHILHLAKGWIGIKINNILPRSYQIVEKLRMNEEIRDKQHTFEQFKVHFKVIMNQEFINISARVGKFLKCYFILMLICIVLDLFDFIVQLKRFGVPGGEYSDMMLVIVCLLLLVSDFYYIAWVYHVKGQMPSFIQEYFSQAMFGFSNKFSQSLEHNIAKAKISIDRKVKNAAGLHKAKKQANQKKPPIPE